MEMKHFGGDSSMNFRLLAMGLVLAIGLGGVARGEENAAALKKRKEELQNKRDALFSELNDVRKSIEKSEAVANAQKAVAAARVIYEAKIAESEKIATAKKAMDDTLAHIKVVVEAQVAANPQVLEMQKAMAAADDAVFDAGSELRIAEYVLGEMRRKAARGDDIKPFRAADNAAVEAMYAARKAGSGVEAAKAARDKVNKSLDEAIAAKVAATPEGQAQLKKIAALEAKVKETRAAMEPLSGKLSTLRSKVSNSDEQIVEARKAADAAAVAYREAMSEEAEVEKAKLDQATKALDEIVTAKLAGDPKVIEIRKQMDGLRDQIREVSAQWKAVAQKGK
jgi:chromosome segregation ATPase